MTGHITAPSTIIVVRCDRSSESGSCTRCARLKKPCSSKPARRRPNNSQRDLRIEALESHIQQLLGSTSSIENKNVDSNGPSPDNASSARRQPSTPLVPDPIETPAGAGQLLSLTPSTESDAVAMGLLSTEAARILLQRFKTTLTPHFPFVVVASEVSLEILQDTRPFLLLCIIAAASYDDVVLQRRLGRQVQHCIAGRMIYRNAISLETLQGLLIHIAWCQYHPRPRSYTQYLQLAIGIVVDLRFDRKPQSRPWKTRLNPTDTTQPKGYLELDEQRAVVGCYYLCSTVSTVLQKTCTFPWTQHIEDCCRSLDHQKQYLTDKYILPIVQIQHTMEQADASDHDEREVLKSTHLTQLILCLETIKGALLFPLAESAMLTMHLHTGIVHACHTNVCTDAALNLLPTDERWPQWRLDALSTGLIAAKSSLSCFLSLPLGHEKSFNNSEWIQLGFVTTCAARLAALSSQKVIRQETHHLRRFLGISDGLKDTIRRLESLSTSTADDDGERDVFYHYRQRVQRIQAWFQAQQERVQRESMQTVSDTADAAAWNGSARQQLPLASSGAQRAWNPGQALPQDSPVLPMDIAWREGDLFDWLPDDLMDMENFGQTFPFDAEGT
ncbi:unnamed protein product [Zymoseptoria tritici ST99CH_3D7]|uniref:Transcription factor domain-containing protein n=1 Tax=Zymoseptoria tritici (strain ST99CH_3D7) TaxID=1276538 RepID=A0A1X7RRL3_ZYMT9|nr:unnamed protein product [Zymoseptoria tritici ST99CH_3D7]